jgi:hypothetical protein
MSDIFSPVGRVLPSAPAGPNVVTGVISDPPRNLAGAASGTILKGTVLGRGPDGLTSVATDKGVVQLATTAQLPAGSAVTLEVRNAGDRLQVLILNVDTSPNRQQNQPTTSTSTGGSTVAVGTGGSSGPSVSGTTAGAASPPLTSDPAGDVPTRPPPIEFVNNSLQAIVVHTPPASTLLPTPDVEVEAFTAPPVPVTAPADAAQKAQLLAQARLLVQTPADLLLASQGETASPVAPGQPSIPGEPVTGAGQTGGSTPSLSSTAAAPNPGSAVLLPPEIAQRIAALFAEGGEAKSALPPQLAHLNVGTTGPSGQQPVIAKIATGQEVTLNIIAVMAAKGAEIEIAPEAAKLTGAVAPLLGTVLGYTRAGHPVIETAAGTIMLQQRARLPVGAQVALILDPIVAAPATIGIPVTSPQQALLQLSGGWPSLDDVIAIFRGGAASDAGPPPPPGMPQTGPKLAAGLSNAIAALRSGDVQKLLGPLLAGRKLPADKEELVKRLREDFAQLSTLAQDRPDVDWRALFLPIYDERVGLTMINLYYRRGGGGKAEDPESKDNGTRFVVEVNFAALGAFQLDGLVRGKRFDLMVRSRRAVPPPQRREMMTIFEDALGLSGNAGTLEFRTMERFPIAPLEELRQSHDQVTA